MVIVLDDFALIEEQRGLFILAKAESVLLFRFVPYLVNFVIVFERQRDCLIIWAAGVNGVLGEVIG